MLRRFKGLKYKGKVNEIQNNEEDKNANKTATKENFRSTEEKKIPGKEGEKDGKDNTQQEIDPKEDINNIENKFNPKREEAYWLEDLYD